MFFVSSDCLRSAPGRLRGAADVASQCKPGAAEQAVLVCPPPTTRATVSPGSAHSTDSQTCGDHHHMETTLEHICVAKYLQMQLLYQTHWRVFCSNGSHHCFQFGKCLCKNHFTNSQFMKQISFLISKGPSHLLVTLPA